MALGVGGALAALAGIGALVFVFAAPSPAQTCEHVRGLLALAREPAGKAEAAACLAAQEARRARWGRLGWARHAWCVAGSETIPGAGRCTSEGPVFD